ncbi:MAG: hypothetical protein ACXWB9_06680 [Flavisolibacter sp.]
MFVNGAVNRALPAEALAKAGIVKRALPAEALAKAGIVNGAFYISVFILSAF